MHNDDCQYLDNYCDWRNPQVMSYWLDVLQVILVASLALWVLSRALTGKGIGAHLGFAATAA